MMRRLLLYLGRVELIIANLSLVLLVVVLAAQIFFRYVLHIGLSWSEETSRFAFVWFVYISASLAAQRGTHIRVTMFARLLPYNERYVLMLADAIWIAFNTFVVISGIMLVQRTLTFPVYSTSLFLPLAYVYMIIPIAHALMIFRIIERQYQSWRYGIPLIAGEGGPHAEEAS